MCARVYTGGDNASRAIAIGMVLGAYHGLEAVPAKLGEGKLVNWQHSMGLLDTLPVIKSLSTDSGYQASRDEL